MDAIEFRRRAETFGLDTDEPWALWALRLLFAVPRAYEPLVEAADRAHPGVRAALDRMVADNWISYQGPVVVDLRTGKPAAGETRKVARYVLTGSGRRLLNDAFDDPYVLSERWPAVKPESYDTILGLLGAFNLDHSHARYGLSVNHAAGIAKVPPRTARWWVARLLTDKLVRELPERHADVREVVPPHWRLKRDVCRQVGNVLAAFPAPWGALRAEWPLTKTRFLRDIDPARIGVSGATDYDHDITAQRVVAVMLGSSRVSHTGVLEVEPKFTLTADTSVSPAVFGADYAGLVFYQPDALLVADDEQGRPRRVVIEYERYQSRRDAWAHIERFAAWASATLYGFESAMLCFVVDTEARLRSYVALIEAFADWADENPQIVPTSQLTLAVSSVDRVAAAVDPLDDRAWFRVPVGPGTGERIVLHEPAHNSVYDAYFGKRAVA